MATLAVGMPVRAATGFSPDVNSFVEALAVQPDGKILIAGEFDTVNGTTHRCIARLNADGTVDNSFDAGPISSTGYLFIGSLALQADGKIVVGGNFNMLGNQPRNYIARLNADGSLDSSFSPDADFVVYCLALQPDGKILAGGVFGRLGGQPRDSIGRVNPDGSLDMSFNPGASGGGPYGTVVYALAVQADGRILVGGRFSNLGGNRAVSSDG